MLFRFLHCQPIHIAYIIDAKYALPLSVSAYSLLENYSASRELHLYIVCFGVSADKKANILDSLKPVQKKNISIQVIDQDENRLSHLRADLHFSSTVYGRFLLPEILPNTVNKVLYLDADTVILDSIEKLYDERFHGYPVLAVQDWTGTMSHPLLGVHNLEKYGLSENSLCFNSGVLLMDLNEWRERDYGKKLLEFSEANPDALQMPDQNALNIVLYGKIGRLNPEWNRQFVYKKVLSGEWKMPFIEQNSPSPKLIHFVSPDKPWLPNYTHPEQQIFHRYWKKTRWPFFGEPATIIEP